jgi:histidyl-tRNA synthetase
VAEVGGEPLPAVGFAMGDVTIGLMIQQEGAAPAGPPAPAQVLLCWVDEPARLESLRLAAELRLAGLQVEWFPTAARLPRQLKYADRQKIPLTVIIGSRELDLGVVTVKDLRDGTQSEATRRDVADKVAALLE